MQIELQMVGVHRNANITIKNVEFKNGTAMVYGADELVGNICRYLETYGAFQPHIAEQKQALLDGEGDMLGIRAARRQLAKADEMAAEARAKILAAQEAVEERLQADAEEERLATAAAAVEAKAAAAAAAVKAEALNGEVENQSSAEGRSSEQAPSSRGSKPNKPNKR